MTDLDVTLVTVTIQVTLAAAPAAVSSHWPVGGARGRPPHWPRSRLR